MIRRPPRSTRTDTLVPYTTRFRSIGRRQRSDVVDRFDQRHRAVGKLTQRADDLGLAGVADEDDVSTRLVRALGLAMDLRHQRAVLVDISSEARPVGTECVSTSRSRWWPCR